MRFQSLLAGLCAVVLTSCGGGGDSPGTGPQSSTKTLTINGTAATGMALASAPVVAKCQAGSGTATTASDGTYTLRIDNGTLPCIVELTNPADRSTLHSVSVDNSSTTQINITPLTEMVVARLFHKEPSAAFQQFTSAEAASVLSAPAVSGAQSEIATILAPVIGTKALTNFISTPFKAATSDSPTSGDDLDKGLDLLKAKLTASQLTEIVSGLTSGSSGTQIATTVEGYTTSIPVARIGAVQAFTAGTTISLDGSASSDGKGNPLTYQWSIVGRPGMSMVKLSSLTDAKPSFTPDMAGDYVVSLTVNNGWNNSQSVSVLIHVGTAPTLSPFSVFTISSTGAMSQSSSVGANFFRPASAYATFWDFCTTPDLNGCDYTDVKDVEAQSRISASTVYDIEMNINDYPSFPFDLYTQTFTNAPSSIVVKTRADLGKITNAAVGKSAGVLVRQLLGGEYAYPGGSGSVTYTFNSNYDPQLAPEGWQVSTKTIIKVTLGSSWTDSEGRPAYGSVPIYSKTFDGSFSDSVIVSKRLDDYPTLHGTYGGYAISIYQLHTVVRK